MDGSIQVYYGTGRGKTTTVLGLGLRVASLGKQVIMVQFLKSRHTDTLDYFRRLEPEFQIFRFESGTDDYSNLPEDKKKEQLSNIKSALSYARKVMDTGQCDLLILDGIIGLVDLGIIDDQELCDLVSRRDESMDLILTGRILPDGIRDLADCVYCISTDKEQKDGMLDQAFFRGSMDS